MKPLGIAVIGAGYWGPNLVRNLRAFPGADLRWVCDLSAERARAAVGPRTTVGITDSIEEVLNDDGVEAVCIATPAATHSPIGLQCIEAGRHVMIEKPLASSVAQGEVLVAAAEARGVVLMCDHTYCYTPAVRQIRELVHARELGQIQYFDSVRINLGLVQSDVNVFWDLAPHDLSILDSILPPGTRVETLAAQGSDPIGAGQICVGYLTLGLTGGALAHIHVNWLSPTKIRTAIIGGSERMIVWDDLHPTQRLSIYDKSVTMNGSTRSELRREQLVSYRTGDMIAPALKENEALAGAVREFAAAIRENRAPMTDGHAGLRVLRALEAVPRSMALHGASVPIIDQAIVTRAPDGVPILSQP